jgi:hemerythrin HHE cation binding domain-containing protein
MLSELMERDHELLRDLLQKLESALQRRDAVTSFQLLDLFWTRLAVHIRAENVCLFPAILSAPREIFGRTMPPFAEVETTIERLRVDHNFFMDQLSRAVKTMREFLAQSNTYSRWKRTRQLNTIRARLQAVSTRLKAHDRLEEERVHEWPAITLNGADLRKLHDVVRHEIENLPPRFSRAS